MKRHAKATSAGPTKHQAKGLGGCRLAASAIPASSAGSGRRGVHSHVARTIALAVISSLTLAVLAGNAAAATVPTATAFATEVDTTEAKLGAEVNPNGSPTTYQFEYVDDAHYQPLAPNPYSEGEAVPAAPQSIGSGNSIEKVSRRITGLTPATTYHFRVVATNGVGTTNSADRTLNSPPSNAQPDTSCPNQQFRIGPSTDLPDCRAYEMVSPVDKNGGDIVSLASTDFKLERWIQSSTDGEKLTFSSYQAFGDDPSSLYMSQYLAGRGSAGWETHGISPPQNSGRSGLSAPVGRLRFQVFWPDLSKGWLTNDNTQPLAPGGIAGQEDFYERNNISNTYSFVAPEYLHVRGFSADGSHIVYNGDSTSPIIDLYNGEPRRVSVLPSGKQVGGGVGAQTSGAVDSERGSRLTAAVSANASRVFWTANPLVTGEGRVFVRENPRAPQSALAHGFAEGVGNFVQGSNEVTGVTTEAGAFAVGQTLANSIGFDATLPPNTTITAVGAGTLTLSASALLTRSTHVEAYSECTEPEDACTVPISNTVTNTAAEFVMANSSGSRALFSYVPGEVQYGQDFYEFAVDTQTPTLIAHHMKGFLGASEDLSYIYFASTDALAAGATEGNLNLYVDHEGTFRLIATLASSDFGSASLRSSLASSPFSRASRVTRDGTHIAFMSAASLTGYDNIDVNNGEADREVYVYDAETNDLECASCNPTGGRPLGGHPANPYGYEQEGHFESTSTAAWLPTWEHSLYASRAFSEDGSRLFFNSFDALVPQDTNGVQDVYEWEAPATGDCTAATPHFSKQDGGCVSLVSSGESPKKSEFLDASADGSNVFFETQSSLLPQDPGLVDIYDAHERGGYPQPLHSAACEGETCQNTPEAPNDPTPASAAYHGPGNVAGPLGRKRHHKKQRRRHHKTARRANHHRRATR